MPDYTVQNPTGELDLLAAGYTIRLHGRKITKKELTENVKNRR